MQARRIVPLALGVAALLALAGIASHGRPLSGSRGAGPSATFFDYVFTSIVLFAVALLVVALYAITGRQLPRRGAPRGRWHLLSSILGLFVAAAVAALLLHSHYWERMRQLEQRLNGRQVQPGGRLAGVPAHARAARLRWDEVAIALALIAGAAALTVGGRHARRVPRPFRLRSREAVSLALDESLDDLRNDPDLRRAIIAAYARMERALALAGRPRRPAEAPFEYLERTLRALDTSAPAVARLTTLFQWARFSQHEPEPQMRDEAIDALVAVRDELRQPTAVPVA